MTSDTTKAARRIDRAHQLGQQLSFLADEAQPGEVPEVTEARSKAHSTFNRWLKHHGHKTADEQMLAIAGLDKPADPLTTAMVAAERVLSWAHDVEGQGEDEPETAKGRAARAKQRIDVFSQLYAAQLRAVDALLPYGLAKASPDAVVQAAVQVVVAAEPSKPGGSAKVVNPEPGRRMAPPPLPAKNEQNQEVIEARAASEQSDNHGGSASD